MFENNLKFGLIKNYIKAKYMKRYIYINTTIY